MKSIPGFAGYLISGNGDLWSFREAIPKRIKSHWHKGYLHVNVKTDSGRARKIPVHQLVLLAFVGMRPSPRHVGRHIDGDTSNNAASNLLWGTVADNINDSIKHCTHISLRRGQHHPAAKLSDADVADIKQMAKDGTLDVASFAAEHNVSRTTVSSIARHDPRYR